MSWSGYYCKAAVHVLSSDNWHVVYVFQSLVRYFIVVCRKRRCLWLDQQIQLAREDDIPFVGQTRLLGVSYQDWSLLDSLISVTAFVFARLGHSLEAEVSIRVIILSVTGNQSRYFQRGELNLFYPIPSWLQVQTNDSTWIFNLFLSTSRFLQMVRQLVVMWDCCRNTSQTCSKPWERPGFDMTRYCPCCKRCHWAGRPEP